MVWSAFEERVSPPERPPWAQNRRRPSMLNVRFLDRPAGHPTARLGRKRRSCAAGHLLRVRLTERALCLSYCASEARFRLR
jgi:hypothetical protein